MGVWMNEENIQKVFKMADKNGDGQLDWNEFVQAA